MAGTRHLILGDTHGDFLWTLKVLDHAEELKISTIFQVGDWGFLWPGENGDATLSLAGLLRDRGQRMYFIDGNHDWHPKLRRRRKWPDEIVYCPRGTVLTIRNDDGRDIKIGCLGGAPSIDRDVRVEGQSWWPEEEITDHEVLREPVDVLLTHESPGRPYNLPEIRLPMSVVYRCEASWQKIRDSVRNTGARTLFHGHYHHPYRSNFEGTTVIGLNCNRKHGAYVVVDHNFEEVTERITGWVNK